MKRAAATGAEDRCSPHPPLTPAIRTLVAATRELDEMMRCFGSSRRFRPSIRPGACWRRDLVHDQIELPSRLGLAILALLAAGPRDVSTLALALGTDVAKVSHHLSALAQNGLVVCTSDRNRHVQALSPRIEIRRRDDEYQLIATFGSVVFASLSIRAELLDRVRDELDHPKRFLAMAVWSK